ncbi:MAG: PIG-L deacetylase family protein, partial [Ginsengibacter sp.]
FISKNIVAGAIIPAAYASLGFSNPKTMGISGQETNNQDTSGDTEGDVVIERLSEDKPHKGKVLAVIQPHCDDIAYYAAGTVAKLIYEGYTGYLIRTSNDDAAGAGATMGERVLNNEKDNEAVVKSLGLKKAYSLNYNNHRMDQYNIQDLKSRLIFLFRLLKVDTLVCYDPWGHYEENPDHYITAKAAEAARWMASMDTDYPEQLEVVNPHAIKEAYYFARGPQLVNRVVDISKFIDKKVETLLAFKYQGFGASNSGAQLRRKLAENGKKLSILGNDDNTANFNYIKEFALNLDSENLRGIPSDKKAGEKYGLAWAERFHYIGPAPSIIDEYIQKNAVPK